MKDPLEFWPFSDIPSDGISIYEGPEEFLDDYSQASVAERIAFSAYWLQAEVLNGGLDQFFDNDTGVLAPEAVATFKSLGLSRLASQLEQSMSCFGHPYPRDRETRQKKLGQLRLAFPDSDPFCADDDRLVDLIYSEAGGLEATAISYIRSLST